MQQRPERKTLLQFIFATKEGEPRTISGLNDLSIEDNFDRISRIINMPASQHSVRGSSQRFTLGQSVYFYIFSATIIACVGNLVYYALDVLSWSWRDPYTLFIASVFISAGIYVLLFAFPSGVYISFTLDADKKTLTVFNDDLLRKFVTAKKIIYFADVNDIYSRKIKMKGRRRNTYWHRIYLVHSDGAHIITTLPFGADVFMESLMSIIKSDPFIQNIP